MLTRSDGATILYAHKVHTVSGEPSRGKTWLAIIATVKALEMGGRVLWWDWDDKPDQLYRRAESLDAVDLFTGPNIAFIRDSILELDEFDQLNPGFQAAVEWVQDGGDYSLVVIDTAESSGAPSDGASIGPWFKTMVKPFEERDIAVLILDHLPKRRQDRPLGPIGSTHKVGRLDGATYDISGQPWTKGQDCWQPAKVGHFC